MSAPDRYAEERDLYGIDLPPCTEQRDQDGARPYLIHRVCGDQYRYSYIRAVSIGEALTMAERLDAGKVSWSYGIMAADYAEARDAGIKFFEGDGLLV